MRKKMNIVIIYLIVLLYLGLPIAATILFSVADKWDDTIFPSSFTLEWYQKMLGDPEVIGSIGRSLIVATATVLGNLLLFVPTVFVVSLFFPKLQGLLRMLAMLPFALPGVILAVGLIQLYSKGPLPIAGTFWILLFSYMVVCLPYMYNAVLNSVQAIDGKRLLEAAETLGAPLHKAFIQVLIPNILPGLINGSILTFSVALGEFVLANMLVGGQYPTLQVILEKASHKDGHLSSSMVTLYFFIVSIASLLLLFVIHRIFRSKEKDAGYAAQSQGRNTLGM